MTDDTIVTSTATANGNTTVFDDNDNEIVPNTINYWNTVFRNTCMKQSSLSVSLLQILATTSEKDTTMLTKSLSQATILVSSSTFKNSMATPIAREASSITIRLNDTTLWKQLASMTLSENDNDNTDEQQQLIQVASHVMAQKISQITTTTKQKQTSSTSTTSTPLKKLSKKVFTKASSMVTSILASYDLLIDDDTTDTNHSHDTNDDFFSDTDQNNNNNNSDDAVLYNTKQEEEENNKNQFLKDSDLLFHMDLSYNCWNCIVEYAKRQIQLCDTGNTSKFTVVKVNNASTGITRKGILLSTNNTNNNDGTAVSFPSFCNMVGSFTNQTVSSLLKEQFDNNDMSLEFLIQTLISTQQATLSSDGMLLVLCPFTEVTITISTNDDLVIDEVDLAIYQLTSTITKLELRIDTLTCQQAKTKQALLMANRKNNKSKALILLKQYKLLENEVDLTTKLLYNVETSLCTLERARSNVQVYNAYEMMNQAIKTLHTSTTPSTIEETMEDYQQECQDMEMIQKALTTTTITGTIEDDDALERELMALYDEKEIDHEIEKKIETKDDDKANGIKNDEKKNSTNVEKENGTMNDEKENSTKNDDTKNDTDKDKKEQSREEQLHVVAFCV